MRFRKHTLREITLMLLAPGETSFGRGAMRRILLVELDADSVSGWGECTAGERLSCSYETVETAWHILRDHVWPLVRNRELASASDVFELLAPIRGHNMAKAALETAAWDAEAKQKAVPLARLLEGAREEIACGVSIGLQPTIKDLLRKVDAELAPGYQRITTKIKPGADLDLVRAVREGFP